MTGKRNRNAPERLAELEGLQERGRALAEAVTSDRIKFRAVFMRDGVPLQCEVRLGHPASFGWLRRAERDEVTRCGKFVRAYERGDGSLVYFVEDSVVVAFAIRQVRGTE